MSLFEEFLKSIGYKPYKEVFDKNNKLILSELNDIQVGNLSTMVEGRLTNTWIKGNRKVYWGLNEYQKPPTLCYPRPYGNTNMSDDEMNRMLKEKEPKEIYELLWIKPTKL